MDVLLDPDSLQAFAGRAFIELLKFLAVVVVVVAGVLGYRFHRFWRTGA